MSGKLLVSLDPYEIPPHLIPPGMIFQWVAKKSGDRIDPQYQAMLEAGWGEVPYERLATHYRGKHRGESTEIMIGGQVLMERAKEMSIVSRDKEIDAAFVQAKRGRDAAIQITQRFRLSAGELDTAAKLKLSSPEYARRRLTMIAGDLDRSLIRGRWGSLEFIPRPTVRVAKYSWLRWLFNLISKETEWLDD